MGCVYFASRGTEDVFEIGGSNSTGERVVKSHTVGHSAPNLYRTIETEDYSACVRFLHGYFGSRRVEDNKECFRLTPDEIARAVGVAESFVSQFAPSQKAVEALCLQPSESRQLVPTKRHRELYGKLRAIREQEYRLQMRREYLENELKLAIGTSSGIQGVATWKSQTQRRFDGAQLKADNPSLYSEYQREKMLRIFRLS